MTKPANLDYMRSDKSHHIPSHSQSHLRIKM